MMACAFGIEWIYVCAGTGSQGQTDAHGEGKCGDAVRAAGEKHYIYVEKNKGGTDCNKCYE